jgi:hypothetical protein
MEYGLVVSLRPMVLLHLPEQPKEAQTLREFMNLYAHSE